MVFSSKHVSWRCYHTGMADLLKALHSGRVLLMDGAMGTELIRAGVPRDACLEALNLAQPELVSGVHRRYVEAGAEVLLTNTFQANPHHLKKHRLLPWIDAIYQKAFDLTHASAGEDHSLLISFGPWLLDDSCLYEWLADCAGRADAMLLETWSNPDDALMMSNLDVCLGTTGAVLASFSFRRKGGRLCTYADYTPEQCARIVGQNAFVALGVNCGTDIRLPELLEILAAYRQVTDLPLFVRPNAGTPKQIDGRWVYPETPESMAAWLPELFKAGVVMVGGCCGTTPAHIAAFRNVVDEWNASQSPRTAVRGLSQDPSS